MVAAPVCTANFAGILQDRPDSRSFSIFVRKKIRLSSKATSTQTKPVFKTHLRQRRKKAWMRRLDDSKTCDNRSDLAKRSQQFTVKNLALFPRSEGCNISVNVALDALRPISKFMSPFRIRATALNIKFRNRETLVYTSVTSYTFQLLAPQGDQEINTAIFHFLTF